MKVLAIGHSYVVRLNRQSIARAAELGRFQLTIAAPEFFQGDLRPLTLEPDWSPGAHRLESLPTRLSNRIHFFHYQQLALARLIREGKFDLVYAWEEPYIASGFQIARAVNTRRTRFAFQTCQNQVKTYPPP